VSPGRGPAKDTRHGIPAESNIHRQIKKRSDREVLSQRGSDFENESFWTQATLKIDRRTEKEKQPLDTAEERVAPFI
jgi:hypothetical protein